MVGTRWRGTVLGIRLCQAVIRHYVASELAWDYIVVRPEMEPSTPGLDTGGLRGTSPFPVSDPDLARDGVVTLTAATQIKHGLTGTSGRDDPTY